MLVTKLSATAGIYLTAPTLTIQIDENHSDMVKFGMGDYRIRIIASKLGDICGITQTSESDEKSTALSVKMEPSVVSLQNIKRELISDPLWWDDNGKFAFKCGTSMQV